MKDIIFPITYKTDEKSLNGSLDGLKKIGAVAAVAVAAASAAFIAFGIDAAKAAAEAEAITRGLENATRNAGVFGDKASSITKATNALDAHSKALGELTGIDDEIINQIKTGWLAVPSLAALGTKGLNNLAQVVADTAAGTGKDITAIGLAFQRVAGDTESAFSKLTRAGIVFTDEQKNTFQSLLDTSGEMAAQAYLVEQLGAKYEGAAEAAANPFERLNVIFGNLKETIGASLLPAFESIIPQLQAFIENLVASPEFNTFLETMATNFTTLLEYLPSILESFTVLGNEVMPALNSVLGLFASALGTAVSGANGAQGPLINLVNVIDDLAFFSTLALDAFNDMLAGIAGEENASEWGKVVGYMTPVTGQLQLMADLGQAVRDMLTILDGSLTTNTQKWNAWRDSLRGLPIIGGMIPAAPGIRPYVPGGLKLAEGGIVPARRGGTLATIGEGGQAEAVIPLDKFDDIVGRRGGGIVINVNAGMGTDGAAVGEQIVNAIRRYERTSGAVFARA